MNARTLLGVTLAVGLAAPALSGQQPPAISGAQFDVVSIKLNKSGSMGGGARELPDGTRMFTNRAIATIVGAAAVGPYDEVFRDGLPDWVKNERYDIIAKPAPDSHPTREQRVEMLRNMLIERFKVAGHIEEVERNGFALVLARKDGKLGPQLTKSTLDCAKPVDPNAPPPMSVAEVKTSCGMMRSMGTIESGGMKVDELARSLRGIGDGLVTNRTGLEGYYAVSLHYSPNTSADPTAPPDDAPNIFTAVQEQLGLKLVPEKTKVKIFVIDHIERPTPN